MIVLNWLQWEWLMARLRRKPRRLPNLGKLLSSKPVWGGPDQ